MKEIDFRCANCARLLAKTSGDTEIKCPRCGAINRYSAETGQIKCIPKDRRNRVTSSGLSY
jgi:LSD1 subclass zinc finger protein